MKIKPFSKTIVLVVVISVVSVYLANVITPKLIKATLELAPNGSDPDSSITYKAVLPTTCTEREEEVGVFYMHCCDSKNRCTSSNYYTKTEPTITTTPSPTLNSSTPTDEQNADNPSCKTVCTEVCN